MTPTTKLLFFAGLVDISSALVTPSAAVGTSTEPPAEVLHGETDTQAEPLVDISSALVTPSAAGDARKSGLRKRIDNKKSLMMPLHSCSLV